jgi:cellulose synthase/poly-beta-1,6-N-acetylglucosamine synthase-like glycosyltransferase
MIGTIVVCVLFGLTSAAIVIYAACELRMLSGFWRNRREIYAAAPVPLRDSMPGHAPTVTIQLPIYNEGAAILPLLRAIEAFDYPRDRMDVQVLDDSNDETPELVAAEVLRLQALGVAISHVRRSSRTGFKAGALAHGLGLSNAEFLAIFDADFVPPPNYLRRALIESAVFDDAKVAFVQGRWTFTNEEQNILTRTEAVLLNRHFTVQKPYLKAKGGTTVFNGSGGVLRRKAIDAVGGWSWDTLCEDLDLSYRWALNGWRGVYDDGLIAPNEIPPSVAAYKLQQRRWAKGSAQCIRKLAGEILRSPALRDRRDDLFVVCGYIIHPIVLINALLWPLVVLSEAPPQLILAGQCVWGFSNAVMLAGFLTTMRESKYAQRLSSIFAAMAMQLGMFLLINNTVAFVAGLFERSSEFERTPKMQNSKKARWKSGEWGVVGAELAFIVYMFSTSALLQSLGLLSASLAGHGFGAAIVFFFFYQFVPDPISVAHAEPKAPQPSALRNVAVMPSSTVQEPSGRLS